MQGDLLKILQEGGPIGALVVIVVLVTGFVLRQKGLLWFAPGGSAPRAQQLSGLHARVGEIDTRLVSLEHDVRALPGREEIHALQLAHERLAGRLAVLETTAQATKAGVLRVEDFLINLSREHTQ